METFKLTLTRPRSGGSALQMNNALSFKLSFSKLLRAFIYRSLLDPLSVSMLDHYDAVSGIATHLKVSLESLKRSSRLQREGRIAPSRMYKLSNQIGNPVGALTKMPLPANPLRRHCPLFCRSSCGVNEDNGKLSRSGMGSWQLPCSLASYIRSMNASYA
jgi:hypothetical protein